MSLLTIIPENAQKLHPDSIKASRIAGLIGWACMTLPVFIPMIFVGWLAMAISGAVSLLLFILFFWWPKKSYQHCFFWRTDEGLYIQQGVIWRKRTLVPINRVQHTDVAQGPLQRKYDLAKLVIHTAGTRDASVTLSGASHQDAVELRAWLLDEGDDDAV